MMIKRLFIVWLFCASLMPVVAEEVALDTAIDIALSSNISIKIQENQEKKSTLDQKINDSLLFPEFSIYGQYNYSDPRMGVKREVIPLVAPLEFNIGRNDMFSYGVQLRYLLYEGGRRSHLSQAADYLKEASRWSLVDRKRAVASEVSRSYVSVLLLKELVHLADENLGRHTRRRLDAQIALQAGTIAGLELLRIRAEEEDAKIARDEAVDQLKIGETQLSLLLNSSSNLSPKGSLQSAAKQAIGFELSTLNQKDPEFAQLMAASLQERAAEESYQAKKSEELPTVVTGLKAGQTNPYLGQKQFGTEYNAFVQLTIPIFDFGRSSGMTEKAKIDSNNVRLQVEEANRSIKSKYQLLIQRLTSAQRSIQSRQVSVDRSLLALSSAQVAYKNGTIDLSRLLDAELLLLKSRIEFLRGTVMFYENLAEWERLSGHSSDQFQIFSESVIQNNVQQDFAKEGETK